MDSSNFVFGTITIGDRFNEIISPPKLQSISMKLHLLVSLSDTCLKFTARAICVHHWIRALLTLATTSVEATLAHHHQNDSSKLHLHLIMDIKSTYEPSPVN